MKINHIESIKNQEYFVSSDLSLITTISLFYPVEAIDRTDPHKAKFHFKREKGLDQIIEAYWKNELKITPQIFFNQLRIIKSRIYEER